MSLLPARPICASHPGVSTRKRFYFEVLERDSGVPLPRGSSRCGEGAGGHAKGRGKGSSSESQLPPRVLVNQPTNQPTNQPIASQCSCVCGGASLCVTGQGIFKMQRTKRESRALERPLVTQNNGSHTHRSQPESGMLLSWLLGTQRLHPSKPLGDL